MQAKSKFHHFLERKDEISLTARVKRDSDNTGQVGIKVSKSERVLRRFEMARLWENVLSVERRVILKRIVVRLMSC